MASNHISQRTIDDVRQIPIQDVINLYTTLKHIGASYKGLCPFHGEKTPSFVVSPTKGIFKCFGCGVSGDAIGFIMDIEKLNFPEAIKFLASKYSISMELEEVTEEQLKEKSEFEKLNAVITTVNSYYKKALHDSPQWLNYITNRRQIRAETIAAFQLGYAPDKWDFISGKFNATEFLDAAVKIGIVKKKDTSSSASNISKGHCYDFFRNRIIIPIADVNGRTLGFAGERLSSGETANNEVPKYLNSSETTRFFEKRKTLYGLNLAAQAIKKAGHAILVEGYYDVINFHDKGCENTVGTMGTAFTDEQAKLLRRYTERVFIARDPDGAGQKSAFEAVDKCLHHGLRPFYLPFVDGMDPDMLAQFIHFTGYNTYEGRPGYTLTQYVLENVRDAVKWKIDCLWNARNEITGNTDATKEIVALIAMVSDKIQREEYLIYAKDNHKLKIEKHVKESVKEKDEKYQSKVSLEEGEAGLKLATQIFEKKGDKGKIFSKIKQIEDYIGSHYELRNNEVSCKLEFRKKGSEEEFKELNEHNISRDLSHHHLDYSLNKLKSLLCSDFIPVFNPFKSYFQKLNKWDCKTEPDFIENLTSYLPVLNPHRFKKHFKKMLVRCIACALEDSTFNKQAFILVSAKQNNGKSTFCRWLCPPILKDYITEIFNVDKDGQITLATNFFINLDELAALSKIEINALKSVLSKDKINVRLPYASRATTQPRRANFIGSTNKDEFLSDETGSVRWLCFELTDTINFDYKKEIDINNIWRQAYTLYSEGFAYQLSLEEIAENETINKKFLINTSEMDLIPKYFKPATKEAHDVFYTATDVLNEISSAHPHIKCNIHLIGKALKILGFSKDSKYNDVTKLSVKGYFIFRV